MIQRSFAPLVKGLWSRPSFRRGKTDTKYAEINFSDQNIMAFQLLVLFV